MFRQNAVFFVFFGLLVVSACSAAAQDVPLHPNGIQPETTLVLSATASVDKAPDVAIVSAGVEAEGQTAREAMQRNADQMEGLIAALKAAGIPENRIQTSQFNLSPRYQSRESSRDDLPRIVGYVVTNQVSAEIRDLDQLGQTLDALVSNGGNRLGNIRFALIDPTDAQNEAREKALTDVMARAEMMADLTGYKIRRIVTMSENAYSAGRPTAANSLQLSRARSADTQVLGGEVSFSATVNITFELEPK